MSTVEEGDDSRVQNFVGVLIEQGYGVTVLCTSIGCPKIIEGKVRYIALGEVTSHFWYGAGLWTVLKAMFQRSRSCVKAFWFLMTIDADLLIAQEPDSWILCSIVRLVRRGRLVVDLQEVYEDRALAFPTALRPIARWGIRGSMWLCARLTDLALQVNKERELIYGFLQLPQTLVRLFPRSCDYVDAATRECMRRDMGVQDKIVFIHLGPLRPSYAGVELVRALQFVESNIVLVALGGIVGGLEGSLEVLEAIRSHKLLPLGGVPHSTVPAYLGSADAGVNLVLPLDLGHVFAQPRKLFEYMGAGLPVLGAAVPTIEKVIRTENCGIVVDPTSAEDIAAGMRALAEDLVAARKLGENGRFAVQQHYRQDEEDNRFATAISHLLDSPKEHFPNRRLWDEPSASNHYR